MGTANRGRDDRTKYLVLLSTAALLAFMATVFWYQDWKYLLPTPRPAGLYQPPLGSTPALPEPLLKKSGLSGRILFLHFFNPGCPCSRFNLDHIRELIKLYGSRVTFIAIVQGEGSKERLMHAYTSCKLDADVIVDSAGIIGTALGVYSTPQAVILDTSGRIYYRGNYNAARYCAERQTQFARSALELLMAGKPRPAYPLAATTAYGCELPKRAAREERERW